MNIQKRFKEMLPKKYFAFIFALNCSSVFETTQTFMLTFKKCDKLAHKAT